MKTGKRLLIAALWLLVVSSFPLISDEDKPDKDFFDFWKSLKSELAAENFEIISQSVYFPYLHITSSGAFYHSKTISNAEFLDEFPEIFGNAKEEILNGGDGGFIKVKKNDIADEFLVGDEENESDAAEFIGDEEDIITRTWNISGEEVEPAFVMYFIKREGQYKLFCTFFGY